MTLRYYEDIAYRLSSGRFDSAPGNPKYIAFSVPGRVRSAADGESRAKGEPGGSKGTEMVKGKC
jgi:hypothetical protein